MWNQILMDFGMLWNRMNALDQKSVETCLNRESVYICKMTEIKLKSVTRMLIFFIYLCFCLLLMILSSRHHGPMFLVQYFFNKLCLNFALELNVQRLRKQVK